MTREEHIVDLIRAHQADVWRYLRMLGCEASRADDLTQEVFIGVFRKPFTDLGPASTGAYLRTAARHAFISSLRNADEKLILGEIDSADAAWSAVTPEDGDSRQLALRECLEQVPERARRALDLRYRDDADLAQIARTLETSDDAVKALLARSRGQLRECIERKLSPQTRRDRP